MTWILTIEYYQYHRSPYNHMNMFFPATFSQLQSVGNICWCDISHGGTTVDVFSVIFTRNFIRNEFKCFSKVSSRYYSENFFRSSYTEISTSFLTNSRLLQEFNVEIYANNYPRNYSRECTRNFFSKSSKNSWVFLIDFPK